MIFFAYYVYVWLLDLSLPLLLRRQGCYVIRCLGYLHVFFADLIPEYTDQIPVIIPVSLAFDITCGHSRCIWMSRCPL